jgi:glycosyltransferase involved in cell wall biosynthesis
MDYSIIIPAYNEAPYLERTLVSVREAMAGVVGFTGECIVVDNNSTDATAEIARSLGATVVFEEINQISRARNAGGRAAQSRYLIFLDADTVLPTALLQRSLDLLDSGTAYAGGSVIAFDAELPKGAEWTTALWNRWATVFHVAAGAYLFCRAELFHEIGGFSTDVFAGEEVWFTRKLKKPGKKTGGQFITIQEFPVITSARKFDWFSRWQLLRTLILLFFFPWLTRSKWACHFWYDRPK